MNLLILFLSISFQIGIGIKFPENMPANLKEYEKKEMLKFFENLYEFKESEIPDKDVFEFGKQNGFGFVLKAEFTGYKFVNKEGYIKLTCKVKVFDIKRKRIYSKDFERFAYLQDTTTTSFYSFLNSLNYSVYSFLSQMFPPFMKVLEIKDNYVVLSNPSFPQIVSGAWIKVFDQKGLPVAYLKVEDIIADKIYTKNVYSEKEIKKGYRGILSFGPSNESGMGFSFSSLLVKADTGGYGNERGVKPFNTFKYGFNLSLYYRWISLYRIGFNISFYPVLHLNLWKMDFALGKGLRMGKVFLLPGAETGVFLGSQRAKNGITTSSVSFFISPFFKFEVPAFKKFSLSVAASYPFSQSLSSFWYERRGGTEYVNDSLLIYKEIKIKGPEIRASFNYKFNSLGF